MDKLLLRQESCMLGDRIYWLKKCKTRDLFLVFQAELWYTQLIRTVSGAFSGLRPLNTAAVQTGDRFTFCLWKGTIGKGLRGCKPVPAWVCGVKGWEPAMPTPYLWAWVRQRRWLGKAQVERKMKELWAPLQGWPCEGSSTVTSQRVSCAEQEKRTCCVKHGAAGQMLELCRLSSRVVNTSQYRERPPQSVCVVAAMPC